MCFAFSPFTLLLLFLLRSLNCSQIESHRAFARRVCLLGDRLVGEQVLEYGCKVSAGRGEGRGGGTRKKEESETRGGGRQGVHFIKLDVCRSLFAKGDGGGGGLACLCGEGKGGCISLTRAPITSISISHVPGVQ